MAAPIYISPEAQRIMAGKQIHRYDVRIDTGDAARYCTQDDVAAAPANGVLKPREAPEKSAPDANGVHNHYVTVNVPARQLGQYESTGSPDEGGATQQGVRPGNAAKGVEETGTGRKGGADNPFDLILGYLPKLDARVSALEKGPRAETGAANPAREGGGEVYQPRGEDARNSPIANMNNLTFGPEHQRKEQQSAYADAPRSALAEKAHGLGPAPPLSQAETRSMTSPKRGPQSPLEDRHQRGEASPRELVDRYPKGDPYSKGGMSAGPDAPGGQSGGGRERSKLDLTTGTSKYGFRETYSTGDSTPSSGDLIRALAAKERRMMKQIRDEISIVAKARWQA